MNVDFLFSKKYGVPWLWDFLFLRKGWKVS